MSKIQLLRRRALQLVLIAAWLALGTVMVVRQPKWWVWFAAVSYVIALFYIVAEVLTWRRALRAGGARARKEPEAPPSGPGSGPSA